MLTKTELTVVLKEEATRVRLHEEKVKKEATKKVYLQSPDRPISHQRQYLLW
jgi:hypothetical protein